MVLTTIFPPCFVIHKRFFLLSFYVPHLNRSYPEQFRYVEKTKGTPAAQG